MRRVPTQLLVRVLIVGVGSVAGGEGAHSKGKSVAAWALGRIGAGASVPPLIAALSDDSSAVREAAARGLGGTGPGARGAVFALSLALKDRNDRVRAAAARTLGEIGPDAAAAVPALRAALDDRLHYRRLKWNIQWTYRFGPSTWDQAAPPWAVRELPAEEADSRKAIAAALEKIVPEAIRRAGIP